jgi:hypothetical protein
MLTNIKKKLRIAIIIAIALALLAGCGGNARNTADDSGGGSGGSYGDLMIMPGVELAPEEYAIAFRVGSDAVPEANKIIEGFVKDGTLAAIAEKYDMTYLMLTDQDMKASAVDMKRTEPGDLDYLKENGEIKIGITLFAPMNYYDDSGNLIGFDTEFAEALCAKSRSTPVRRASAHASGLPRGICAVASVAPFRESVSESSSVRSPRSLFKTPESSRWPINPGASLQWTPREFFTPSSASYSSRKRATSAPSRTATEGSPASRDRARTRSRRRSRSRY